MQPSNSVDPSGFAIESYAPRVSFLWHRQTIPGRLFGGWPSSATSCRNWNRPPHKSRRVGRLGEALSTPQPGGNAPGIGIAPSSFLAEGQTHRRCNRLDTNPRKDHRAPNRIAKRTLVPPTKRTLVPPIGWICVTLFVTKAYEIKIGSRRDLRVGRRPGGTADCRFRRRSKTDFGATHRLDLRNFICSRGL
ncbi:MAG: hypothetical protein KatS3mg111_1226 [Pirellulaceae bacterium]|nr:MAG: hypothetical protein KatS3mg111_1226 [Pirellulaceae bacterium]